MESVIEKLNSIKGIKNVRKLGANQLEINLFSEKVPGREAEKISGNLKKISQKISSKLSEQSGIQNWEWVQKPSNVYDETPVKTEKVSDRKKVGHKPAKYLIFIRKS